MLCFVALWIMFSNFTDSTQNHSLSLQYVSLSLSLALADIRECFSTLGHFYNSNHNNNNLWSDHSVAWASSRARVRIHIVHRHRIHMDRHEPHFSFQILFSSLCVRLCASSLSIHSIFVWVSVCITNTATSGAHFSSWFKVENDRRQTQTLDSSHHSNSGSKNTKITSAGLRLCVYARASVFAVREWLKREFH